MGLARRVAWIVAGLVSVFRPVLPAALPARRATAAALAVLLVKGLAKLGAPWATIPGVSGPIGGKARVAVCLPAAAVRDGRARDAVRRPTDAVRGIVPAAWAPVALGERLMLLAPVLGIAPKFRVPARAAVRAPCDAARTIVAELLAAFAVLIAALPLRVMVGIILAMAIPMAPTPRVGS